MTELRAGTAVVAVLWLAVSHAAPVVAQTSADDKAVNGVFTAVSDGEWAKTNERYAYRDTIVRTWTIRSSCTTFVDCTGSVSSDEGWTAELRFSGQVWRLARTIEGFQQCGDGSTAPGEQTFIFWPRRGDAPDRHDWLSGWDRTVGASGDCGVNRWHTVSRPFTLTRAP